MSDEETVGREVLLELDKRYEIIFLLIFLTDRDLKAACADTSVL